MPETTISLDDKARYDNASFWTGIATTLRAESDVELSGAAPTVGQVLTALDAETAAWQDPAGGGAAAALQSATTEVDVSAAAAPVSGQALVASGPTAAAWQYVDIGGAADAINSATTQVDASASAAPSAGQALLATSDSAASWQDLPAASALKSATTEVNVSAAAAPSVGQALVATSDSAASWQTVSASPGGADTQMQYNNAGAFGGIADFTYDGSALAIANTTTLQPSGAGANSLRIGTNSLALNDRDTGVGVFARARGGDCVAVGYDAGRSTVTNGLNTAVGASARYASGTRQTAIGYAADAGSNYATALGALADATTTGATALGYDTSAGARGVAIGYLSTCGTAGIAIGDDASASGFSSMVAIGDNAVAQSGGFALAVGTNTLAAGQAVAIGGGAQATVSGATAVGFDAVGGALGVSVGWDATSSNQSVAVGYGTTTVGQNDSVALGYDAEVTVGPGIAIGSSVSVGVANRCNIGHPTTANALSMALQIGRGLGVWGSTPPAAQPTITGSRGSNAALASLLTALAATGLIVDGTTA